MGGGEFPKVNKGAIIRSSRVLNDEIDFRDFINQSPFLTDFRDVCECPFDFMTHIRRKKHPGNEVFEIVRCTLFCKRI